jgi:hypothetical protein
VHHAVPVVGGGGGAWGKDIGELNPNLKPKPKGGCASRSPRLWWGGGMGWGWAGVGQSVLQPKP